MQSLGKSYRAIVVGATGGLGGAFVSHLDEDPNCAQVVALSRSTGFDLTNEDTIEAAAKEASGTPVDLLIIATGALSSGDRQPEKTIRHIERTAMLEQFAVNAIGPALILKHFSPLLRREGRSVVAVLSARVGSIGDNRLGGWISYRSAKAAVNQIVRTAAIEIARGKPDSVIAAIHPGTVATRLSEPFAAGRERLAPNDSAGRILGVLDDLRPEQSGGFFAYDGTAVEW